MSRPYLHGWPMVLALLVAVPILAQIPPGQHDEYPGVHSSSELPARPAGDPPALTPSADVSTSEPQLAKSTATAPVPAVQPPPPTQEEVADALKTRQRYQAAIAAYAKIEHPSASVWNKMGIAHQMMLNFREATRCYNESLKLEPRNPLVINNLATIYDAQKEYRRAEKLYRKALKIEPKSAMILKNLGTNLLVQRKYSKGWKAYQEAMAIDPQIFNDRSAPRSENPASTEQLGAMNYYMARGCLRSGHTDCAIDYLRQALNEGFTTPKKLKADEDFASLRDNPAFQELLAAQNKHP